MGRRPVFLPTQLHSGGTIAQLRQKLRRRNFEVWFWRVIWISWLIIQALSWK
jgi:hypothetical protein